MKQVNGVGEACPVPVIMTKRALAENSEGPLEVLVDNNGAVQNVSRFADSVGYGVDVFKEEGVFHIILRKGTGEGQKSAPVLSAEMQTSEIDTVAPVAETRVTNAGKTVALLSSDMMGTGEDALGRTLMKSFVFALTQLDELPDTVLLYNAGAKLSTAGAETVGDLQKLEQAGVTVMTCGACLKYFDIEEQLAVGQITNMYSIVEEMRNAGCILRP